MNRYITHLAAFIMAATVSTQAQEVLSPAQNAENVNIDTLQNNRLLERKDTLRFMRKEATGWLIAWI